MTCKHQNSALLLVTQLYPTPTPSPNPSPRAIRLCRYPAALDATLLYPPAPMPSIEHLRLFTTRHGLLVPPTLRCRRRRRRRSRGVASPAFHADHREVRSSLLLVSQGPVRSRGYLRSSRRCCQCGYGLRPIFCSSFVCLLGLLQIQSPPCLDYRRFFPEFSRIRISIASYLVSRFSFPASCSCCGVLV